MDAVLEPLAAQYAAFEAWEATFDTHASILWARAHSDLPVFAVAVYLVVVFWVRDLVVTPWRLRSLWAFWNLLLAGFSMVGVSRTVPHLINVLRTEGVEYTLCTDPEVWFLKGSCGLWVSLFIFSKIPELLDTVFLVLQKKPVIFLHWFHHVTVLMYCWHAYVTPTATGLWFASINYSVHAVMYLYYFLSISGGKLRSYARPIAPWITSIQLLQMVAGASVTAAAARRYTAFAALDPTTAGEKCVVDPVNFRLGLAMYLSYLCLFGLLFYTHYLAPGGKHADAGQGSKGARKGEGGAGTGTTMCGVEIKATDAAGLFHGGAKTNGDKKKA